MIQLIGSALDTGAQKIWCDAWMDKCLVSDTMVLTVFDDTGIEEYLMGKVVVYPNPFLSETNFTFYLLQPADVVVNIYNHLGEQVEVIRQQKPQGKQQIRWKALGWPAGMYYFSLNAGDQIVSGKMVVID